MRWIPSMTGLPAFGVMAGWLVVRLGGGPAMARLLERGDAFIDRLIPDRPARPTLDLSQPDGQVVTNEPIRPGDRPGVGTPPL